MMRMFPAHNGVNVLIPKGGIRVILALHVVLRACAGTVGINNYLLLLQAHHRDREKGVYSLSF